MSKLWKLVGEPIESDSQYGDAECVVRIQGPEGKVFNAHAVWEMNAWKYAERDRYETEYRTDIEAEGYRVTHFFEIDRLPEPT